MLKNLLTFSLLTVAAVLFAGNAHALDQVGWNYQGVGGVGLNATDVAGAPGFEQANWNTHVGAGQGPGAVPFGPLNDSTGASSGITVTGWTLSANNSWTYGESANPDQILMNDFSDTDPVITLSGINNFTPDGYTVVVYYGNNEWNFAPNGSDLDVNGQVQHIRTNGAYSSTGYVLNTDNGATGSNYAVFTGVTGDVLQISLDSTQNDGISAIQIIEIPEPASLALLGLGGLVMLRRRRRG